MALLLFIALIFLIFPFLSIPLVIYQLFRSQKYRIYYGMLFALAIGILVYHIVPTVEMDLSRYYSYLDILKQGGFASGIAQIWGKSDPLSYTYMYLVTSIFNNNAITLISSLIGYGVLFYIIFDYSKIRKISSSSLAAILLLFLGAYNIINSFTGIRFALGTCIFLLAIYLDVVKKRRVISLFLYILSPLLHTSMITLLMIRIAAHIFRKSSSLFQYALIFAVGLSTTFLQQISQVLSSIPFLSILGERADFYLLPAFPSGFWYPFNIVATLIFVITLLGIRKKGIATSIMLKINLFVLIIAIANVMNYYIASRYMIVGALLFVVNLVDIAVYIEKSNFFKGRRVVLYGLFAIYLLMLIGYFSYQVLFLTQMDYVNLTISSWLENVSTLLK